jgi:hypothetical protein
MIKILISDNEKPKAEVKTELALKTGSVWGR